MSRIHFKIDHEKKYQLFDYCSVHNCLIGSTECTECSDHKSMYFDEETEGFHQNSWVYCTHESMQGKKTSDHKANTTIKDIVTENFKKDTAKEIKTMFELLRNVYDVIEMNHLTDGTMIQDYSGNLRFPKSLGNRIFGYLQSKDKKFRETVIKRQNKWRKYNK